MAAQRCKPRRRRLRPRQGGAVRHQRGGAPHGWRRLVSVGDAAAGGDCGGRGERCYDTAGAEHAGPVRGVSIVVRRMSDGSTVTDKVVR